MKILTIADIHLQNNTNFGLDIKTGLSKRLVDQQKVLKQVTSIAIEEKVDAVLFLGDLIHSVGTVSTEVLNTAYMFFSYLKNSVCIPTYFVPGNHDLSVRKSSKWYHYSCKVFDPIKPPDNIKIIGYHEEIDYEATKGFDIVAIHKTPINTKIGGFTFKDGFNWEKLSSTNKLILVGHIHHRQHLSNNCIIVGSPMSLTFGDEMTNERGIYLVDTDSGKAEFRKLDYPEFLTVENYSDTRDDGNYYRVLNKDYIISDSLQTENIKVQSSPIYIEERIKSTEFNDILKEWLEIQNKPANHLDLISDIIDESRFLLGKVFYNGRLQEVTIKDFLSVGEINYKVEKGFTAIVGPNGNGKTSLVEAIGWCLTGKTTKGLTADDVIRNRPNQQSNCKVTLKLISKEGKLLEITRSRKNGLEISEEQDGDEFIMADICGDRKSGDAQKLLEAKLGFDEKIFRTACYFSQENLLMLTGLEDADRTKMITDLLGFESYNDLYTKTNTKIEKIGKEVVSKEKEIVSQQLKIANTKGKLETYNESLNDLGISAKSTNNKVLEYIDKKNSTELELGNLKTTEIPIRDFDSEEKVLADAKDFFKKKVEHFTTILDECLQSIHNLETEKEVESNKAENANEQFLKLVDEIGIVEDAKVGVYCPECGSIVSEEGKNKYILSKKEELEIIKEKRDSYDKKASDLNKGLQELRKLGQEHSKTDKLLGEISLRLEKDISNLAIERRNYESKRNEQRNQGDVLRSKIQGYEEQIKITKEELKNILKQIDVAKVNLSVLELSIERDSELISSIKKEIEELNEKISILEFWKIAFSPKGIRALLLDKFCNSFNKIVNNYLSTISNDTMRLIITPVSTLKGGEERNKLGITVRFKEYEVKYNALSGGEKRRVDTALIFSLSKYLEVKHNLGEQGLLGLMILDEVFSGLDVSGRDILVALLEQESKNKAIFVIDHTLDLSSSANRVWTVNKENDISSLEITSIGY